MRQWTFVALLAAMLGAAALVLLAWRVQQHALADVRRLATQLEAISVTDELTQLYNRRGFLFVASPAFSLARRQGKPAAVLYADLDGLKVINDQLGTTTAIERSASSHRSCDRPFARRTYSRGDNAGRACERSSRISWRAFLARPRRRSHQQNLGR